MASITKSPSSVASGPTGGGAPPKVAWSNPADAEGAGTSPYATVTVSYDTIAGMPNASTMLECTGCDFSSIPSGSTINGVAFAVMISCGTANAAASYAVMLMLAGAADLATLKSPSLSVPIPTTAGLVTFGGPTDLWGLSSLSVSDVQNAGFGGSYQCTLASETINPDDTPGAVTVQSADITVWYTPPTPPNGYHVYSNGGSGPINYATPIATVNAPTTTYTTAPLAYPGTYLFGVRAFFGATGYEEMNVQVLTQVILSAAGADATLIPNRPLALTARATAGGEAKVEWSYTQAGQAAVPAGFKVWLTAGTTVNYAGSPAATVAWNTAIDEPVRRYSATLSGLSNGTIYSIGVRAYSGSLDDGNTVSVQVSGDSQAPSDVVNLTATATPLAGQ